MYIINKMDDPKIKIDYLQLKLLKAVPIKST
jgi:hypothetical protein